MIDQVSQQILQTGRQRQEIEPRDQLRIPQPIGVTQLQTTATTIYTAGDNADFEIGGLIVTNVTSGDDTISLYFVPDGGTADLTTAVAIDLSLTADTVTRLSQFDGMILAPGTSIQATGATNDAINITGWGFDYQGAYA